MFESNNQSDLGLSPSSDNCFSFAMHLSFCVKCVNCVCRHEGAECDGDADGQEAADPARHAAGAHDPQDRRHPRARRHVGDICMHADM